MRTFITKLFIVIFCFAFIIFTIAAIDAWQSAPNVQSGIFGTDTTVPAIFILSILALFSLLGAGCLIFSLMVDTKIPEEEDYDRLTA